MVLMLPWDERCIVLLAALALDWLIGDPPWLWSRLPHPVVLIGRLIGHLDALFNRDQDSEETRRLNGLAVVAFIIASTGLLGWLVSGWAQALPLGIVLEIAVVTVLLAGRSLDTHVKRVADALASGSIANARRAVSHIVGRETGELDGPAVSRAAIESASENFADGLIAPALWYLAGGLPGILVYKAINTADSMIGYRSERHGAFGKWTAHIDDAANLIPARWTGLLIVAAAALRQRDARASLRIMWRDAPRHVSPNAGWPEAAMAGALGIALGGPRRYGGQEGDGLWLNEKGARDIGAADIEEALSLTRTALLLQAVAVAALAALAV